ncbi:MAG: hypothetical protein DWP97_13775, partial [Calditrichaeota bacterium]
MVFVLIYFELQISARTLDLSCNAVHDVGKLVLKTNTATFLGGNNTIFGISEEERVNCLTTKKVFEYGAEYPKQSRIACLNYGGLVIGGIIDNDTLMSRFYYYRTFPKEYRSVLEPASNNYENAISEQDFISIYQDNIDTLSQYYDFSNFGWKSLNIEVTKKSYAWSYEYTEDFVLFDIEIKNIGVDIIREVYVGIGISFAVGYYTGNNIIIDDDIGGLYNVNQLQNDCANEVGNIEILWGADNDGDPIDGEFTNTLTHFEGDLIKSATIVSGICFLDNLDERYKGQIKKSFNWWTTEYTPQSKQSYRELLFDLPSTREDYYHELSNGEIDYDQIYTSKITQYDPSWVYPDQEHSDDISDGFSDAAYLLSIGPYDLPPGATVSIPFAYVAGEDFHTNPNNIDYLPHSPQTYYKNLDFSDIAKNAMWARWIYDNPGVDTDGDGDSGRYVECNGERIWVEGDGIPDWKAAGPPPAPYFWLTQQEDAIHVRFNGSRSETEKDIFTKIVDFEGYNIYFGRDDREASLSLVASYDLVNYDKYVWHPELDEGGKYIVEDIPYSLDSLKCLYSNGCDDSLFDPTRFTAVAPLVTSDSIFYFTKHHNNALFSAISKVYPNARDPRFVPEDSLIDDDFTEEGFYKYFEYEFTIDNLLPTVEYWVNITAFDFGSPKSGLQALETSKTVGLQMAYPLSHEEVVDNGNEIFVYPNPYRIDANYRGKSFEGIGEEDRHVDRVRKINFANLPPKCEIKIFSLDGDLIRHLHHDVPASDPTYTHHTWDLITRNTQLIVSGMYYWT